MFVLAAAAQLVAAATLLVQLLAVRWLLTEFFEGSREQLLERVTIPLVVLVVCVAVAAIGNAVRAAVQPLVGERISRHTLGSVMAVAARSELEAFESPELYDQLHHTTVRAVTRPLQMASGVLTLVAGLGGVVGVGIALVGVSPWLILLVLLGGVPAYVTARRTSRALYDFDRARAESDRKRSYLQMLFLTRPPAKEVRGYQLELPLLRRWHEVSDDRLRQLGRLTAMRVGVGVLSAAVGAALTGSAIVLLLFLVQRGDISVAAAGTGALALLLLATQVQSLVGSFASLQEGAVFVEDYLDFVGTPVSRRFVGTGAPDAALTRLSAERVEFSYPGGPPVLHGVDLTVEPGQVVALVGRNGSGKTTLVKLLSAQYLPSAGRLRWNDAPFEELDVHTLRGNITPVFQDPTQFQVPVREYVSFGRADVPVDDDAVASSLSRAEIADTFAQMPNGLRTQLGPEFAGGADLSGGQWQRLALARALYRHGQLVVLDEPASALDALAEAELFGNVRTMFPGAAVVIVSHRFGTVRDADVIHVVDDGRIVESGDHDHLMQRAGLYAAMFEAQRSSLLGDDVAVGPTQD